MVLGLELGLGIRLELCFGLGLAHLISYLV